MLDDVGYKWKIANWGVYHSVNFSTCILLYPLDDKGLRRWKFVSQVANKTSHKRQTKCPQATTLPSKSMAAKARFAPRIVRTFLQVVGADEQTKSNNVVVIVFCFSALLVVTFCLPVSYRSLFFSCFPVSLLAVGCCWYLLLWPSASSLPLWACDEGAHQASVFPCCSTHPWTWTVISAWYTPPLQSPIASTESGLVAPETIPYTKNTWS